MIITQRHADTHGYLLRRNYISALVYGAAIWASKKAQENKLEVAEIIMLRWMCGVTKLHYVGRSAMVMEMQGRRNREDGWTK